MCTPVQEQTPTEVPKTMHYGTTCSCSWACACACVSGCRQWENSTLQVFSLAPSFTCPGLAHFPFILRSFGWLVGWLVGLVGIFALCRLVPSHLNTTHTDCAALQPSFCTFLFTFLSHYHPLISLNSFNRKAK